MFQIPGRRADSVRIGLYTNFLDTTTIRANAHFAIRKRAVMQRTAFENMVMVIDKNIGSELTTITNMNFVMTVKLATFV